MNNIKGNIHYRIDLASVNGANVKCNLNCRYCHKDFFPISTDVNDLPRTRFTNSIGYLENIFTDDTRTRKIHFSGRAEPLILSQTVLYDELKSIDDEFPRIEKVMTTNAYLLPGKAELLYKNGVRRINVSVHDRSIYNTKFKKGIESAVENGIIICLNAIIERDKITSITEIIDFAKKYRVNIKFFPILGITNEETTELLKIADAEIVKYSFMSKFDKTKNRMIYHITENIAASLKYPADFEERPETCQACYLRDKCLEGCWDSIRITPWYIKPCGVRTDNIYYFSQNDTDKLKEKLISGGKLLNN